MIGLAFCLLLFAYAFMVHLPESALRQSVSTAVFDLISGADVRGRARKGRVIWRKLLFMP
ncbi:MAG: hypothetical protein DU429_06645 [Candidatus Tokpelaia sp.]|nr:MAG: hypothetical protein DU430_04365 [Candidatus Tokpelaia sp.]KAA6206234.1 MAG: hypothetical protein DU429_06645 [Candidatus Tokpelaia sp.]